MKYSSTCCVFLGLLGISSGHDTRHHGSSGNLRTKHHDHSTENRHQSGNGRAKPPPGTEEARQVAPPPPKEKRQAPPPRPKAAPRQVPPLHSPRSTGLLNLTDTYDDFEAELVEICSSDTSFPIGDDCDVSLVLEDLIETEFDHIFDSMCSDDDVIITMDLEDNIPSHVTRMHPYSGHWTELIAVPDEPAPDGCMYFAIVSNTDIDPEKEKEELGDEHRRKLSNDGQALGAFQFGQDSFFPFSTPRPEGRKLESCSQYNAIRLAIQYDSDFCTEIGGGTAEGAKAALHSIINTMNKFFQAAPLCFTIQSCDIKGYCSASSDPLQGVLQSAETFCAQNTKTLAVAFREYVNGNPLEGCDTTHLVFGGDHAHLNDAGGCAYRHQLCNGHAIGTNKMLASRPQMSHVKLLAHELGHNLNLLDSYPQDTTYIMGTGQGDAGFKPERMSTMQDFVNQKRQEDPSCTAVTSQVVDLDTDGLYVQPDVEPAIKCAAVKAAGQCPINPNCKTTCTNEGIPVFPDVDSAEDCAARKRQGYCDISQYQVWAYETCSTTCSLDEIPILPDSASAEQCAHFIAEGYCNAGSENHEWALRVCSTTCAGGTDGGSTGGGTDGGSTGGGTDGGATGGGDPIPDVQSADDCAYWKGQGECVDGHEYHGWMLENCATTCATDGGTTGGGTDGGTTGGGDPNADVESADDCAYWKGQGYCDDGSEFQAWMHAYCATTCPS